MLLASLHGHALHATMSWSFIGTKNLPNSAETSTTSVVVVIDESSSETKEDPAGIRS